MLKTTRTAPPGSRRAWLQFAMATLVTPWVFSAHADLEIGQPVQALDIELIDGTLTTADQWRSKTVIYLFWATWCPICVGEMAAYQALRNRHKSQGLELLALALDQEVSEVRAFAADVGYDFPMAMRSDAVRGAFGDIRGTPTVFIVDRRGIVGFKHLGAIAPDDLGRIVETLLEPVVPPAGQMRPSSSV
ncbi:MAG: TlpA disulfide reductase family protein [Candidatus Accumulibacter meliphilus]|uniref:TlpA family protein disulfide reductase n=1 Tax=Candidatus Accumulibacter meliphilus TaxID=2211374 RepID=UPI002FC2E9B7